MRSCSSLFNHPYIKPNRFDVSLLKEAMMYLYFVRFALGYPLRTLLAALLTCFAANAIATGFTQNESLVTKQADLIDAEYSQLRGQITWIDSTGSLWVAGIDRSTGLYKPRNGKGVLIDTGAVPVAVVGNGPEWVSAANTDQIVYTKALAGKPYSLPNSRLAFAQNKSGSWSYRFLSANLPRNAPYASKDAGDTNPRISYVDPYGNHYWRNLYDSASESIVPWYPASYRSLRFVKGARAAVFSAPVNGVSQVFRYWLDTQLVEQVTFDDGDKDLHSVPWMWQAPEFGNQFVLSTLVNDVELRVYRQLDSTGGGQGPWTMIYSAVLPQGGVMNSPEPFTHNGKSYVFMAAAVPPQNYPSQLFLSNIDASQPMFQQLTTDSPLRMRNDPEVFVTDSGPYIYFNRFNPALRPPGGPPNCDACSEGVYRTYTGLPPATAP